MIIRTYTFDAMMSSSFSVREGKETKKINMFGAMIS